MKSAYLNVALGAREHMDSPKSDIMELRQSDIMAGHKGGPFMRFIFLALALVLFFTWIGAFVVFHVAAALIHVLLILAVVFLVIHLFRGRRAA